MAREVQDSSVALHPENKWFVGDLYETIEEDGRFGPQIKWVVHLDSDDPWVDDQGNENTKETWLWCSEKLTTHEKNKFRKIVKGLTGSEPKVGELFDEKHYTKRFYEEHDKDPKELTGKEKPWRVAVMFEHRAKDDGTKGDSVSLMVSEDQI